MTDLAQGTILYGMMGCGKTTLGEGLAVHLGQTFVDTDQLIEERFGLSCADIVADPTRDFADAQAESVLGHNPSSAEVVATGGSVGVYPELVEHLAKFGIGIFINADPRAIESRLPAKRIAALNNPKGLNFFELYEERAIMYRKAARFVLNVRADESPVESLSKLIELRSQAHLLQ